MNFDPELMQQLIITFESELEEQSQLITNGLLALEKGDLTEDNKTSVFESIFRSAHNIKGAARGLGIKDVGEIAHKIESLFNAIQKEPNILSTSIINRCLEAVDKMQVALKAFAEKKPLEFNLDNLLKAIDVNELINTNNTVAQKNIPAEKETPSPSAIETKIINTEHNIHETIRVSMDKIHKISTFVEEIQVNKIAIEDTIENIDKISEKINQFFQIWKPLRALTKTKIANEISDLTRLYTSGNDILIELSESINGLNKTMHNQTNELSSLSNSLQEEIRMLRLISASHLLCHFPRYVRDLSQELEKQVELSIIGDDVKVDKLVLEGLKNPINHLLRNAIDHGIENADLRKKNNKPVTGHIKIEIKDEGSQVIINISDDGAGIDIKKITNILIKNKMATQSEIDQMNENDILDFIFRPGFSTKQIVTNVSGRGIGLDVVKANIADLKGSISVITKAGKGTSFSLQVPLTLSSERGLLVKTAKQLFVIPTHVIERVMSIAPTEVINIEGSQAVLFDQQPISLQRLADILGYETTESIDSDTISILIIKLGRNSVALIVEEVIGEREIVIKPIQHPLDHISYVTGGTLLERNQVVIVLNPIDLINSALHSTPVNAFNTESQTEKELNIPHILVVDDSITTRTLEKNILEGKNYKVTVAVNGKEAWDILQKQNFSLLITDVTMPIMDGFTLTEKVKNNEKLKNLPVIIVTSLGSDAEKARGIEVGANAYIVKNDFESSALLEIVSQLV